jgi:tryptophan synthase alpha chain
MINNRVTKLFDSKKKSVLNIYFTAGFPNLNDTVEIIKRLEKSGADLIEVGIPYSDPLADGPTIQKSGEQALKNGLTLEILFNQIIEARKTANIPIILMGYVNQMLQYGVEKFIVKCAEVGVDGLIIPDLPPQVYSSKYQSLFEKHNISFSFLVTPQTETDRIKMLDELSSGFLYIVSSASITGAKSGISNEQLNYFEKINSGIVKSPKLIGFGISDKETFDTACRYANGAIIGSGFIKMLSKDGIDGIESYINSIFGE